MSLKWKHLALATLPLLGMSAAQAAQLTSLEWPPYTSASLPEQGKTSQVVTAAFALAGDPLTIKFYPWQRAVDEATNNPEVLGYFPEYLDPKSSCIFSDPIGHGISSAPSLQVYPERKALGDGSQQQGHGDVSRGTRGPPPAAH